MKSDDINTLITHRLEQAKTALDDAKFLKEGNRSTQIRFYKLMSYKLLQL